MSESRNYVPSAVEVALRGWLLAATAEFTGVVVQYSHQGKPRNPAPLLVLHVIGDRRISDAIQYVLDEVIDTIDGVDQYRVRMLEQRTGTVQVMAYGNQRWPLMGAVALSLDTPFGKDATQTLGVEILDEISPAVSVPDMFGVGTEGRVMQDFRFAYGLQTDFTNGVPVLMRVIASGDAYQQTPGDGSLPVVDESWP